MDVTNYPLTEIRNSKMFPECTFIYQGYLQLATANSAKFYALRGLTKHDSSCTWGSTNGVIMVVKDWYIIIYNLFFYVAVKSRNGWPGTSHCKRCNMIQILLNICHSHIHHQKLWNLIVSAAIICNLSDSVHALARYHKNGLNFLILSYHRCRIFCWT